MCALCLIWCQLWAPAANPLNAHTNTRTCRHMHTHMHELAWTWQQQQRGMGHVACGMMRAQLLLLASFVKWAGRAQRLSRANCYLRAPNRMHTHTPTHTHTHAHQRREHYLRMLLQVELELQLQRKSVAFEVKSRCCLYETTRTLPHCPSQRAA